jgi:hypothetical protein
VGDGSYSLTAVAYDTSTNSTTSTAVNVTVDNTAPTVVRLWSHTSADNSNVWSLPVIQDISADINENGVYEFRFGADFRNGNDNSAQTFAWFDEISVDVTAGVDTTPPTGVAITDPTEGQRISGGYTISANATDETGMDRVEFYYDGTNLIGTERGRRQLFADGGGLRYIYEQHDLDSRKCHCR